MKQIQMKLKTKYIKFHKSSLTFFGGNWCRRKSKLIRISVIELKDQKHNLLNFLLCSLFVQGTHEKFVFGSTFHSKQGHKHAQNLFFFNI